MGFVTSILASFGVATIGFLCLFGFLALVIIGIVVGVIVWGMKNGKVRVSSGERNFDDFGR